MAPLNARSGHTYSLTSSEVSSIRAHVKHDAYMHNGQRRGKQKHNLSQKIEKIGECVDFAKIGRNL